jgi:hypothetical protein
MTESLITRIERDARRRRARYMGELFAAIAGHIARLWARRGREQPCLS